MTRSRPRHPNFSDEEIPRIVDADTNATATEFIGGSEIFQALLRRLRKYASLAFVTVLLEGETGTGKTMLARYLHSVSPRGQKPFLTMNVGTINDELASAELFGHERGSFTGADRTHKGYFLEASGGTLFLDELGKASLAVQQRLVTTVETGMVTPVGSTRTIKTDTRVIAATNVSIDHLVATGAFLPDLAARLTGSVIRVPPLRERREDIPQLAKHFVAALAPHVEYRSPPAIDERLMRALTRHHWPANIREMSNAMLQIVIEASPASVLKLEHCTQQLEYLRRLGRRERSRTTAAQVAQVVTRHGSVRAAAAALGLSVATVYRKLPRGGRRGASAERNGDGLGSAPTADSQFERDAT